MGRLLGAYAILNRLLFHNGPSGNAFLSDFLPEECILRCFNYCCVGFILLPVSELEQDDIIEYVNTCIDK